MASEAAKSDDAAVQVAPWRLRIQLVFPSPDWALERLERLMMKFYRRRLFHSLLGFLRRTHGDDWQSTFLCAARHFSTVPIRRVGSLPYLPPETSKRDLVRDVVQGFRVIGQNAASTWWEWSNGSSLIFWRWSTLEQRQAARDGMPVFVTDTLPTCRQAGTSLKLEPGIIVSSDSKSARPHRGTECR